MHGPATLPWVQSSTCIWPPWWCPGPLAYSCTQRSGKSWLVLAPDLKCQCQGHTSSWSTQPAPHHQAHPLKQAPSPVSQYESLEPQYAAWKNTTKCTLNTFTNLVKAPWQTHQKTPISPSQKQTTETLKTTLDRNILNIYEYLKYTLKIPHTDILNIS